MIKEMYSSFSSKFGRNVTTIHPGEHFISGDVVIHTLLGTCVSVVLYSPEHRIGGLNHYMLPDPVSSSGTGSGSSSLMEGAGRYGVHAMELLINGFLKRGIPRGKLVAKVFGGGKVLMDQPGGRSTKHVGEKNVEFVLDYLDREKIPIAARDLGGEGGRKIYFFPWTGKVLVGRIQHNAEIISVETAYNKFINRERSKERVILFGEEI